MQRPESWLKKVFTVKKAAIWLQEKDGKKSLNRHPLLRLPLVEIAPLLPVYAIIEGTQEAAGRKALHGIIDVTLQQVFASVSPAQVKRLQRLSALAKSLGKGEIFVYTILIMCLILNFKVHDFQRKTHKRKSVQK